MTSSALDSLSPDQPTHQANEPEIRTGSAVGSLRSECEQLVARQDLQLLCPQVPLHVAR